jgi:hypothetical protein
MSQTDLNYLQKLNYFKRQRNLILLLAIGPIALLIALFFILWKVVDLDMNILTSIYLIVALGIGGLIFVLRSRMAVILMQYYYFVMLNDNLGLIPITRQLFTKSWLESWEAKGYKELSSDLNHLAYYQYFTKISSKFRSSRTLIVIVVAKNETFDFYGNTIEEGIQSLLASHKEYRKVNKVITLQFQKFTEFNADNKEKIDKIINFKQGEQYLINLTIGYFPQTSEIYYLRPKKVYPNALYYHACQMISETCGVQNAE